MAAIGLSATVGIQAYRGALAVASVVEERAHRRQVILAIENTLSSLKDSELGMGGLLITRNPIESGYVVASQRELKRHLAELLRLTEGEPAQARRAARVRSLLEAKLGKLARTLEQAERHDEAAARAELVRDRESHLDEELRYLADRWVDEEQAQVDTVSRAVTEKIAANTRFILWSGIFTFLLVVGITFTLRRQDRRRRFAERELAEFGKDSLLQLMEAMPQIVWTTDAKGSLNFCNQRWTEYTGVSPAEAFGRGWRSVLHPADVAGCEAQWRRAVERGVDFDIEYRFRRAADDAYRWHLGRAQAIHDESGRLIRWVGTSTDIHDQKQAADQAYRFEQKLNSVLRSMPMILWATDQEGLVTLSEGVGLRALGLRAGEAVGKNVFKLGADPNPESHESIRRALRGESFESLTRRGDLWIQTQYSPLRLPDGTIDGMVGVSVDVTERKQLEAEHNQLVVSERTALQASEMKSTFLANMSHELRTPINGVLGMVSLLIESGLRDEQREYAEIMRSSSATLLALVNDILDLSKAEAGKIDLEEVIFSLPQLAIEVERMMKTTAQEKGLRLQVQLSAELSERFLGDPTRLRQILLNLMTNAIKFTASGQVRLEISPSAATESGPAGVRFEVSDTGIGVEPDAVDRIFQSFTQADVSTTRRYGGTGLGLSICQHLVTLMGGRIGVQNAPGSGSLFWFVVPLPPVEAAAAAARDECATPAHVERAPDARLRILLAEDNSVNQLIAVKMLERLGHEVVAVVDGQQAVARVVAENFDLVLMDCLMPELDGYEATRRIRAAGRHRAVPIVAMTANAMRGDREKCLAAGMTDYISKPMSQAELRAVIVRATSGTGSRASEAGESSA